MARKTAKTFDCIEFKRRAQSEIYEEIKELTPQQQIEHLRERAESGPLGEWWKRLKDKAGLKVEGAE